MNLSLAILRALAKWPESRIGLDDVKREVEIIVASADQAEQLRMFSALGSVDIFQSGLVSKDDAGLQITDAGLSLLRSLEGSSATSPTISSAAVSPALRMIDAHGVDADVSSHQSEQREERESATIAPPDVIDYRPSNNDGDSNQASSDGSTEANTIPALQAAPQEAPAFQRRAFGSRIQEPSRTSSPLSKFFALVAARIQMTPALRRRDFAREAPSQEAEGPGVAGAAFALLSLIAVVTCIGAAIALGQIKSLKSEIATLHRELLPLRERLGKLEKIENTKRDLSQLEEAQNRPDTEGNRAGGEPRTEQAALNLSREEIQLIRDYIKPAPSADTGAPTINVGDPIGGATIPLPSPLTEKVPRLVGARFTTRNGAIIISTKNSRRADAVLAPN